MGLNKDVEKVLKGVQFRALSKGTLESVETIFGWIGQLSSFNTSGVEPLINPVELYGVTGATQREDLSMGNLGMEELLEHSSCKESGFFVVPKVIKK